MYQFVKTLNVRQALLQKGSDYYVASFANTYDGSEVLVFPANENGEVTDWLEVDGGRNYASLNQFLNENLGR